MPEFSKEPCPYRIAEDFGGAFSMGCLGGGFFQAIKGFRNAPTGLDRRLLSSITAIKIRSPLIGGNFAIWGGTFSVIECTLTHFRKREDPWNSIWSGVATGGILAARKGSLSIVGNALVGGILMTIIELTSIMVTHFSAESYDERTLQFPEYTAKENSEENHKTHFRFFGSYGK